jgi:hypothetical protein
MLCIFFQFPKWITPHGYVFFITVVPNNHSSSFRTDHTSYKNKNKLCGFSSQANYTNRVTATCRRS